MAELKNRLSDFRFIPALSGEPLQSDWNGERGLITDVVDRSLDGELSQYEAYLCGKPRMIEGVSSSGEQRNCPGKDLFRSFNAASIVKIILYLKYSLFPGRMIRLNAW